MMKFERQVRQNGVQIPPAALTLSKLGDKTEVEMNVGEHTLVLIPKKMTAGELMSVVESLNVLSSELTALLIDSCDFCEGCEGHCPYEGNVLLNVPDYLRECAGIPTNAKLCVETDPDNGTITITETQDYCDVSNIPVGMMEIFRGFGVCLDSVDDLLAGGTVIYGNEQ